MALADDISQAMAEQPPEEQRIFPATVNTVSPLTVTLDGSGVALPCLAFGQVTLTEGRRVGVIKLGADLVVFGSFGSDTILSDVTVSGSLNWGGSEAKNSTVAPASTPGNTTYGGWPGTKYGVVFKAPPSGRIMAVWSARVFLVAAWAVGSVSIEVRVGNTLGSGAVVFSPDDTHAVSYCNGDAASFMTGTAHKFLSGLTPGQEYAAELMRLGFPASQATVSFANLTICPQF